MDQTDIDRVARQLFEDNANRRTFRPLRDDDAPGSLATAYRIQDRVHELFETVGGAGPLGGHKIALTSKAVQELCGVDRPAYGGVFRDIVQASPATLKAADFMHIGLEFEVAVRIAADVPASGAPFDRETITDYAAACAPAFEVIEDRNADYGDLDAESILADRCWCAGVVHGPWIETFDDLDLASLPVTLTWNDKIIDQGVTGASMDHPFEGLAWIANHLAARGRSLKQGEIVITGSALKTRFPDPGDTITYAIDGLGETSIRVET
jgi:2-keto-4-pentenoate hydratase